MVELKLVMNLVVKDIMDLYVRYVEMVKNYKSYHSLMFYVMTLLHHFLLFSNYYYTFISYLSTYIWSTFILSVYVLSTYILSTYILSLYILSFIYLGYYSVSQQCLKCLRKKFTSTQLVFICVAGLLCKFLASLCLTCYFIFSFYIPNLLLHI